jgi:UDP-N-acetylglucosamine 1-carboxyvinyltransferase
VEGDARLSGLVRVGGAKNAVLALLAGTLACSEPVTLTNVPDLRDVRSMIAVLESVGAKVTRPNDSPDDRAGGVHGTLRVDCSRITTSAFTIDTVSKLRASFFAAGPMLARTGRVEMPLPGGCAIGARPVDLHLRGFEALGARVRVTEEGTVIATTAVGDDDDADGACRSTAPLRGRADVSLRFPSVGATHSLMTAAALAEGTTVIRGAAAEPEVADLAAMLNAAGADIRGAGTDTITVRGVGDAKAAARMANDSKKKGVLDVASVASLGGCAHRAIPDRIEAGTFLVAAAVTRSSIELEPVILNHVRSTMDVLEAFGCAFETSAVSEKSRPENENETSREVRLRVIPPASRTDARPVTFATAPFPGVPTDMQPQLCVLASAASGVSFCRETVFESRVAHVEQLRLMGVDAVAEGETVTVFGGATTGESEVSDEQNAYAYETRDVFGSDLRATAALVLAGLCAKGTTRVFGLEHLDRGYERLDEKLRALGADVARREE